MAEDKKVKVDPVRVIVRVHIPSVDPGLIGELHTLVKSVVKPYAGAEVELSVLPAVRVM